MVLGLAGGLGALLLSGAVLAQNRITIATVVPLSGPLANVGAEVAAGTRAFFTAFNRAGGFQGREIELVVQDDGNDPKRSAEAARAIVAKHAPIAFVNCFGTVGCMAQAEVLKGTGIPMIGPIAGAPSLRTAEQKHVFAVRPNAAAEVAALADHLKRFEMGEVAVVYQDDGFGRSYLPAAERSMKGIDLKSIAVVRVDPARPDYPGTAQAIKSAKAKGVLLLANVTHSVGVLKALADEGVPAFAFNLAAQANAGFIKGMSDVWSYSVFATFTPSPWKRHLATVRDYQDAWQAVASDRPYSYLGFESYVNARVLGAGLQRLDRKGLSSERLAAALESMPELDFDGMIVKFGSGERQGSSFVDVAVLSARGKFVQ